MIIEEQIQSAIRNVRASGDSTVLRDGDERGSGPWYYYVLSIAWGHSYSIFRLRCRVGTLRQVNETFSRPLSLHCYELPQVLLEAVAD